LDLSKFILSDHSGIDFEKLEVATKLGVKFLDSVIDKTSYPTIDIEKWAIENRAIGLGIMGFADYCLLREIAYGSEESKQELENILKFIYDIAEKASIQLGQELGVPKMCQMLPVPRRNVTVLTIAPTGTISLIAGCSSGIEPVFSEITIRNDKTGTYTFENDLASKSYFRCAVAANGAQEVTWEEHIGILSSAQKYIDSGVSKTINFPNHTHRETIAKAVIMAWKMGCKGIASYRNGSRKVEVLSPKNLKKDKCPSCGEDVIMINGKKKCTNTQCNKNNESNWNLYD
jgi:ribonucleoside-diphosphate reductase alpha chain